MTELKDLLEYLMPFLEELARTIEGAAPVVWRMMALKVLSEAAQYAMWGVLALMISFSAAKQERKANKSPDKVDEWGMVMFCVKWVAAIICLAFLTAAITRAIALDYYVMLHFVQLLKGSSY